MVIYWTVLISHCFLSFFFTSNPVVSDAKETSVAIKVKKLLKKTRYAQKYSVSFDSFCLISRPWFLALRSNKIAKEYMELLTDAISSDVIAAGNSLSEHDCTRRTENSYSYC